jgi:hypothetical protein
MLNVVALHVIKLNVVMLTVVMLNIIIFSVIILNVVMLTVVMLNVIILSVIILNVVAPSEWAVIFQPARHLIKKIFNSFYKRQRVIERWWELLKGHISLPDTVITFVTVVGKNKR